MKKLLCLLLALSLAAGLTPALAEGSLAFISQEPNTLNLLQSKSNLDADVFYLTSAMLYRPYDGVKYPELAEGYTVSEDGLTYTYTIRDAVYSDGTPIVADDLVYYMIHAMTSDTASYYVGGEAFLAGEAGEDAVGIKAVDDHTFTVTLVEAVTDFDPELTLYPLQRSFAEEQGDALGGTPENMMYSGPYVLKEWVFGSYMVFEKNPLYIAADTSFPLDSIRMINTVDDNGKYSNFITGEADIIVSVSSTLQELIPDRSTHFTMNALQGLEFNTRGMYFDGTTFVPRDEAVTAVLANQNFRYALSYALNRTAIVNAVNPSGTATNRLTNANFPGNTDEGLFVEEYPVEAVPMEGDEALAKDYLAKALEELGYASAADLPKISYLTFDSEMYRLMAETVVAEWDRVLGLKNIEIQMQPVQSAVMSMVFMNFDIYWQSFTMSPLSFRGSMAYWRTGGGVSDPMGAGAPFSSIYSNPEFDALVDGAKYEFDRTARMAMLAKAEQIFLTDAIFLPVQFNGMYYAASERVEGFVNDVNYDGYMFNQTTVK